jgi:hypothetical protein
MPVAQSPAHYINSSKGNDAIVEKVQWCNSKKKRNGKKKKIIGIPETRCRLRRTRTW